MEPKTQGVTSFAPVFVPWLRDGFGKSDTFTAASLLKLSSEARSRSPEQPHTLAARSSTQTVQ